MDQNEIAAHVDEKVQRTMAVFALRRIRAMIDQEAEDEIATRKFTIHAFLWIAVFLSVIILCASAFGAYPA